MAPERLTEGAGGPAESWNVNCSAVARTIALMKLDPVGHGIARRRCGPVAPDGMFIDPGQTPVNQLTEP